ncbi:hypothetical protein A260_28561, partial [Pseudomonas syringae pv. actinidiae ICMP 19068]
ATTLRTAPVRIVEGLSPGHDSGVSGWGKLAHAIQPVLIPRITQSHADQVVCCRVLPATQRRLGRPDTAHTSALSLSGNTTQIWGGLRCLGALEHYLFTISQSTFRTSGGRFKRNPLLIDVNAQNPARSWLNGQ